MNITDVELIDAANRFAAKMGNADDSGYKLGFLAGASYVRRKHRLSMSPVNRNYLNLGDTIETHSGIFAKIEKLEYKEVHTDKGVIKKADIKQVYVENI